MKAVEKILNKVYNFENANLPLEFHFKNKEDDDYNITYSVESNPFDIKVIFLGELVEKQAVVTVEFVRDKNTPLIGSKSNFDTYVYISYDANEDEVLPDYIKETLSFPIACTALVQKCLDSLAVFLKSETSIAASSWDVFFKNLDENESMDS